MSARGPYFARLRCTGCGVTVHVEIPGSKLWDGQCLRCGVNLWEWTKIQGAKEAYAEGLGMAEAAVSVREP